MTDPSASMRGAVDLSGLVERANGQAAGQGSGAAQAGAGQQGQPGQQHAPGGRNGGPQTATVPNLVIDVTEQSFPEIAQLSTVVPVIIDLWAEWCEPCKQLRPVIERVVRSLDGRVVLGTVDVDANPRLAQAFGAQSIPLVVALVGGQPVQLFNGAVPEPQVRQVFEQLFQLAEQQGVTGRVEVAGGDTPAEGAEEQEEPLPPHHQEAIDAIETGDYALAASHYEKAITENPRDELAKAGLAQVQLLDRLKGGTLDDIRSKAAANPSDVDAQLAVADLDVSGGHVEDAFARLLDLFPTADPAGKERIRKRLVDLFTVVGVDDPRVVKARARLTSLLF